MLALTGKDILSSLLVAIVATVAYWTIKRIWRLSHPEREPFGQWHMWPARAAYAIIDVSGSIPAATFEYIRKRLDDIVQERKEKHLDPRLFLIFADTTVRMITPYNGQIPFPIEAGQGGTDLQKAFDQLPEICARNGGEPGKVYLFTDGYTDQIDCGPYPTWVICISDQPASEIIPQMISNVKGDVYVEHVDQGEVCNH